MNIQRVGKAYIILFTIIYIYAFIKPNLVFCHKLFTFAVFIIRTQTHNNGRACKSGGLPVFKMPAFHAKKERSCASQARPLPTSTSIDQREGTTLAMTEL